MLGVQTDMDAFSQSRRATRLRHSPTPNSPRITEGESASAASTHGNTRRNVAGTGVTGPEIVPDTSALLALAERCEKATAGDRELSCTIAKAIGWTPAPGEPGGTTSSPWAWCPDFTTSLDAAMTLAPEGWAMSLNCWARPKYPYRAWRAGFEDIPVAPFKPTDFRSGRAEAATPALAVCAAAIRARLQEVVA